MATAAPSQRIRALAPEEVAWGAVLPCAALIVAAIVLLGPPLGHALLTPEANEALWPHGVYYVVGRAEPVKHARFAIALLGPLLLAALLLAERRRPVRLSARTARRLIRGGKAATLALLVVALAGQRNLVPGQASQEPVFSVPELLAALAVLAAGIAIARSAPARAWIAARATDGCVQRRACLLAAIALTACWLAQAVNNEGSIGHAAFSDLPPWAMADTLAILDGRTPLVDVYPLYGTVWAYAAAVPMLVFGASITTFSLAMTTISGISLVAVYATLRRVVRSALLALGLYVPVLAIGFLVAPEQPEGHASNAEIFSVWPIRYAGPYLLAWLTARHVDGDAPRRTWPLFLAGGLVAINNVEFGAGALLGTVAALLVARPPRSRREAGRMAGGAAAGLLGAAALVALLTLVRSGALPDWTFLTEYPRVFGTTGLVSMPMAATGLHLALYATYTGAIGVAVTRALRGAEDRLLSAMLAWSGVFGLLAGSYFAGRSDSFKLMALLSAWGFSLVLLVVVVLRAIAARGWRRPAPVELAVLFGFALAVVAIHDFPAPWSQPGRLAKSTSYAFYEQAPVVAFVRERTHPHERVAILISMSNRIARQLSLVNVSPYPMIEAIATRRQLGLLVDAMRREGAHKAFVEDQLLAPPQRAVLRRAGFAPHARSREILELTDRAGAAR
jgi:hypothetical protein